MRRSTATFSLTDEEMKTLQGWVRQGKAEYRMVERARIVLLANEGRTNQQIADHLRTRRRAFPNGGSVSVPIGWRA